MLPRFNVRNRPPAGLLAMVIPMESEGEGQAREILAQLKTMSEGMENPPKQSLHMPFIWLAIFVACSALTVMQIAKKIGI